MQIWAECLSFILTNCHVYKPFTLVHVPYFNNFNDLNEMIKNW